VALAAERIEMQPRRHEDAKNVVEAGHYVRKTARVRLQADATYTWRNWFRTRRLSPIVAILIVVGAYRASLVGRGAMAFLDETMYYKAGLALDELRRGHVSAALAHLASNNARPGNAVLQLAPAAMQAIPFAFGVPTSNPRSLIIPVAFNAITSLVTLYVFWRISLVLFDGNRPAAAIATPFYGLLLNSNLYVRHLLACEPALCVGMIALMLAVERQRTAALGFLVGMISAFTVTVYPGYFLFALIPGVVVAGLDGSVDATAARLRRTAAFICGFAVIIAATEIVCRAAGVSYIAAARALSGSISQGDFDEGWVFLPEYLIQIERYAGAVLLAGAIVFVGRTILDLARREPARPLRWVVLPAIGAWLCQAVGSAYAHDMVLYGRLIHPWMAFLVWASIGAVAQVRRASLRQALYLSVAAASALSWARYAADYARVAYPADVLYALGVNTALLSPSQRRCTMRPVSVYDSPAPLNRRTGAPYTTRTDYLLVNFCQGVPVDPPNDRVDVHLPLMYRASHFMAFRAYGYEGLAPRERREMQQPLYDLRVYTTGP
jgi:hypothetical protein